MLEKTKKNFLQILETKYYQKRFMNLSKSFFDYKLVLLE